MTYGTIKNFEAGDYRIEVLIPFVRKYLLVTRYPLVRVRSFKRLKSVSSWKKRRASYTLTPRFPRIKRIVIKTAT